MKERRKDLPWLLLALLAIAFTVTYGWYQLHRSTNEVLLVHRNDALIMTESIEQQGSLTTGGLKDAVIKDENGKRISYEELEEGDYILITTDNYVLLSYPMQYSNIYKVQKTGESDRALAESIYQKYKTEFAF